MRHEHGAERDLLQQPGQPALGVQPDDHAAERGHLPGDPQPRDQQQHPGYCVQVRIEFETMTLTDPDEKGSCKTEYVQVGVSFVDYCLHLWWLLQVTGGVTGTSVPTLCGSLAGQHLIYTPITNFPARLSVVTDQAAAGAARSAGHWL